MVFGKCIELKTLLLKVHREEEEADSRQNILERAFFLKGNGANHWATVPDHKMREYESDSHDKRWTASLNSI